jgi:hypothetical protein
MPLPGGSHESWCGNASSGLVGSGNGRIACVAYNFVAVDRDELMLMPVSMADWLPEDQHARFVLDVVAGLDRRRCAPAGSMVAEASRRPSDDARVEDLCLLGRRAVQPTDRTALDRGRGVPVSGRWCGRGGGPSHRPTSVLQRVQNLKQGGHFRASTAGLIRPTTSLPHRYATLGLRVVGRLRRRTRRKPPANAPDLPAYATTVLGSAVRHRERAVSSRLDDA